MTLLERIAARLCAFEECIQDRTADAQVCPRHLNMLWRNELERTERGTYVARRRTFVARDMTDRRAA